MQIFLKNSNFELNYHDVFNMDNMDWKEKLGLAFNIDPNSVKNEEEVPAAEDVQPNNQRLDIMLDKRNRNGKKVTLIVNFDGSEDALKQLAKELKQHCGVGGSARGGEILIQGDFRNKIFDYLKSKGYKARII